MRALFIFCIVLLGGCATTAPVVVRGNSYCKLASEITWSTDDTRPTISEIRIHNAKRRKVCGS